MKKFYFLAIAATVLASSCANEESVFEPKASQEIAFQAVATNASRAAVTSSTNWKAPIYVSSAYLAPGSTTYSNLFNGNPFVEFTPSTANTVWTSAASEKYYYPSDGKIDFLAYASGSPAVMDDGGNEIVSSNIKTPTATVAREDTDGDGNSASFSKLTLDYAADNLAGATDVMYALTPNFTCPVPTNTNPNLTFKHALAWLSIEVEDPKNLVYITSIKANNVYLTGKLDVTVTDHVLGDPVWTTTLSDKQDAVGFPTFCPATPTLVESLTGSREGILVVPGEQTQITLVYRLKQNPTVDITHVIDLQETFKPAAAIDPITWEAGKHYTYKISFNSMSEIQFNCSVEAYADGGYTDPVVKP